MKKEKRLKNETNETKMNEERETTEERLRKQK